jgi:hypothetical protein
VTDLLTPADPDTSDSDPLDHLLDGDPRPLREWLDGAGVDVEALWRLPRWNATGDPMPYRRMSDGLAHRETVLDHAFARAQTRPGGIVRLLAYVHYQCDQAWDVSYHFTPIWETLRAAGACWARRRQVAAPAERTAADAFDALLAVLDREIQVENATTCGLLGEAARLAGESAAKAGVAVGLADTLIEADPAVARYVGGLGRACAAYDGALGVASGAVADLLDGTGDRLDAAIEALRSAERELAPGPGQPDDPDASELRAHRYSLEELREVRARDWLYVDTAQVVYVYPFALRGREPVEVVEAAAREAGGWRLCGVTATEVHARFNLDDVWHSSDTEGRRFDGVQVALPELTLTGPHGVEITTLRAELRLSRLGNHYLRFEGNLVDADPQDVYAALMRAAPEHGRLAVSCAGVVRPGSRLADFAIDLIEETSRALGTTMSARPGMFQVLLNVYAASVGRGPAATDRTEVRTLEQVTGAVGSAVLFRPVANMINTLAEWARYPKPVPGEVISGATNLRDHVVLRTCNTTVQVALGLAHWSLGTAGTVAEFAATLEGLFAGWFDDLGAYQQRIRAIREPSGDESAEQLQDWVHDLREDQIRLHKMITEARSTLALISSPALVASPVVAEQLTTMVEAAGTERRSRDFARRAEEVLDERLGRSIETLARQRAELDKKASERSDERRAAWFNVLTAIVAGVGFSGVGQIFQSGFQIQGWRGTWLIVCAIMTLALSVGVVTWRISAAPRRRALASAGPGVKEGGHRATGEG